VAEALAVADDIEMARKRTPNAAGKFKPLSGNA
jgi:hypothetical protein